VDRRMKAWFALAIVVVVLGSGFVISTLHSYTAQAQNGDGAEFVIQSTPLPPTSTPLPPTSTPLPPTATPSPTVTATPSPTVTPTPPRLHMPFIRRNN